MEEELGSFFQKKALTWIGLSLCWILFFLMSSGCQQQFDPRNIQDRVEEPSDSPNSLQNTRWVWDSPWGHRTLFFLSPNTVRYTDQAEGEYTESYTYNENTKKGEINYYGKFEISNDNKTMHFIEWKNYGHGSDFELVIA
jgi:hypothetical protein